MWSTYRKKKYKEKDTKYDEHRNIVTIDIDYDVKNPFIDYIIHLDKDSSLKHYIIDGGLSSKYRLSSIFEEMLKSIHKFSYNNDYAAITKKIPADLIITGIVQLIEAFNCILIDKTKEFDDTVKVLRHKNYELQQNIDTMVKQQQNSNNQNRRGRPFGDSGPQYVPDSFSSSLLNYEHYNNNTTNTTTIDNDNNMSSFDTSGPLYVTDSFTSLSSQSTSDTPKKPSAFDDDGCGISMKDTRRKYKCIEDASSKKQKSIGAVAVHNGPQHALSSNDENDDDDSGGDYNDNKKEETKKKYNDMSCNAKKRVRVADIYNYPQYALSSDDDEDNNNNNNKIEKTKRKYKYFEDASSNTKRCIGAVDVYDGPQHALSTDDDDENDNDYNNILAETKRKCKYFEDTSSKTKKRVGAVAVYDGPQHALSSDDDDDYNDNSVEGTKKKYKDTSSKTHKSIGAVAVYDDGSQHALSSDDDNDDVLGGLPHLMINGASLMAKEEKPSLYPPSRPKRYEKSTDECFEAKMDLGEADRAGDINTPKIISGTDTTYGIDKADNNINDERIQVSQDIDFQEEKEEEVSVDDSITQLTSHHYGRGSGTEQPGAVAVPGPGNENNDATASGSNSQHQLPNQGSNVPSSYVSNEDLLIAAEVVPEEKDIEAIVQQRLDQETEFIESQVHQRMLDDAVQADVMEDDNDEMIARMRLWICCVFSVVVVVVVTVILLTTLLRQPMSSPQLLSSESPSTSPTDNPRPMLETVLEQGRLRCGVGWNNIGYRISEDGETYEGMEVDLCHAVAAALFNDTNRNKVEITVVEWAERWEALENRSIDLLTLATTHTMERDVFQETAESGFTFSIPYLYGGIAFGGIIPELVACADKLDAYFDECRGTRVCVAKGTSGARIVNDLLPDIAVRVVPNDSLMQSLIDGTCTVIADYPTSMVWNANRRFEEIDNFTIGSNLFSKEPNSMVTREDDPQWSDFVNYVLQSLFSAEAQNITQDISDRFMTTNVFGTHFKYMFINAIKAVGNYAEFYARNVETFAPRKGLNLLNVKGDSGLVSSHPFGSSFHDGPGPVDGGTLDRIQKRGHLRCGIINRPSLGLGEFNPKTQVWSGLDADYCRALSASIFADADAVVVDLSGADEPFLALSNETVDVLAGGSLNLVTDVMEPISGEGFSFTQPYFYGPSDEGLLLALATRQDDPQWSDYVYFVVTSTFYAEENAITGTNGSSVDMPEIKIFGPGFEHMLRNAILAVGNYGEMYARNVEQIYPRNGTQNQLNMNPFGPQHYPLSLTNLAR